MKKLKGLVAAALAVALLVSMTSCKLLDKAKDALDTAKTGEELYYALATAARSPDNAKTDSLPGSFTFSAYVTYGEDTFTVGDDEVERTFFWAVLARDVEHEIAIEITDYKGDFPAEGDYVSVKATFYGSLYWVEDGKQVDVLWLKAVEVAPLTDKEVQVNNTATAAVQTPYNSGEITFLNAHFSEDTFGKVIVLYFNFKNTGTSDVSPILDILEFYTTEDDYTKLTRSYFGADQVDGSFLSTSGGIPEKTAVGKSMPYFLTIKVPEDEEGEEIEISNFSIEIYDDDFNLAYQYVLDVAEAPAAE
ncbi:MAG: hypothetical protein LBO63_07800 [Oscillospiraceae bacterium]|jgi:hypothetical protein|nr:hypothetical protein [Oscillospiraceae bacterium]